MGEVDAPQDVCGDVEDDGGTPVGKPVGAAAQMAQVEGSQRFIDCTFVAGVLDVRVGDRRFAAGLEIQPESEVETWPLSQATATGIEHIEQQREVEFAVLGAGGVVATQVAVWTAQEDFMQGRIFMAGLALGQGNAFGAGGQVEADGSVRTVAWGLELAGNFPKPFAKFVQECSVELVGNLHDQGIAAIVRGGDRIDPDLDVPCRETLQQVAHIVFPEGACLGFDLLFRHDGLAGNPWQRAVAREYEIVQGGARHIRRNRDPHSGARTRCVQDGQVLDMPVQAGLHPVQGDLVIFDAPVGDDELGQCLLDRLPQGLVFCRFEIMAFGGDLDPDGAGCRGLGQSGLHSENPQDPAQPVQTVFHLTSPVACFAGIPRAGGIPGAVLQPGLYLA